MDPSKSMRAMAGELEVSATLVCKIGKEDLQYKSYGLRKGQFMSEAMKLRQLEKTKKRLSLLKHPPTRRFGLLAAHTATPSTIMSGASLNGMLTKPSTTLRSDHKDHGGVQHFVQGGCCPCLQLVPRPPGEGHCHQWKFY